MPLPYGNYPRMSQKFRGILFLAITILFLLALCHTASASRDVRVGMHEIKPSLYTDEQGMPAGIFVDLIQDIAAKEGWNLIYVHGTFRENQDRLANGQIDLIMALTDTPEREKIYDFNREAAVSSWTQIYASPHAGINTILDLDKKRVAILRGDVNAIAFRDNAVKFNINPIYIEQDDLSGVFQQVKDGSADAAVASRIAGQIYEQQYGLVSTSVMFYPNPLGFAVPKGKNPDLLIAIDRYLMREKGDPSSYYSQTMQKWFGEKAGWVIPPYIWWGLTGFAVLAALFVVMSVFLQREVRRKTAELSRQNTELQSEITSRTLAEEELVRKNEELQAAYEELTATEEELRANYLEIGKSKQSLVQARKKLNFLNTLTFQDIQNGVFSVSGFIELAKGSGCSEAAKEYLGRGVASIHAVQSSLRFAKNYQDLGISQPRWQNVNTVFLFAISHLDLSPLSRTVNLDGLEIYADPLFEKVLFSLMENVVRHGKGATRISLHYQKTLEGILILVEDDGPGIPSASKEKIFERGYAGKGESGLFLAREILSLSGISIRETGVEGVGARFEILVPEGAYQFPAKDQV
jgi:ABC-type amino acid transport substrate-binding protein/signal transduction histidine kinase